MKEYGLGKLIERNSYPEIVVTNLSESDLFPNNYSFVDTKVDPIVWTAPKGL